MPCLMCRKELGDTKVAVGWGKEVHPACYETYLLYVKQIKETHAEAKRERG